MAWLRKNGINIALVMALLLGVGFIAYPSFADWWNSFHQSRAVASYAEAVSEINTEEYEKSLQSAVLYNRKLAESGILWMLDEEQKREYDGQLKVGSAGILGYIDIPKINVMLPVYHGTEESVLQVAVGHLEGTSLPVGGEGTHCILTGHRGLPSARLFTDIDKLVEGDTFIITVLNKTLTYEVDHIEVTLPTEISSLQIQKGMDYVTLVTCTPYGINTHRLLVRGHRIENVDGEATVIADALQIEPIYIVPFVAGPMLVMLVIGVFVMTGFQTRGANRSRHIARQFRKEKR